MKLPIKPMSGAKFEVDVDDTETVLDVKNKITWVRPENPIETQTLIYRGQMLKDEQKLVDLKLDGSSFFVLMTRRMAPAAPKKPVDSEEKKVAEEKPAPAPAPVPVPAPAPAPFRVPIPAPAPAPAPAVPSSGGHDDSVNTLAMGESYAKAVEDLCGMGFPKEDVEAAMRAAFNSPERAAQYLIDGIPPQLREVAHPPRAPHPHPHPHPAAPAPAPAPAPTSAAPRPPPSTAPTTTGSGSGSAPVSGGLEDILSHLGGEGDGSSGSILRRHPLMLLLRFVAQQDRGSLVPLLQALSQQNPELVEIVRQNQEEFAALLEEPLTEAEQEIAFQMMASGGGGGGGGGAGGGGGRTRVQFTPEEAEALRRLMELGFEQDVAVQAFLACDRNEELAANFLFDHGLEMMEDSRSDPPPRPDGDDGDDDGGDDDGGDDDTPMEP